EPYPMKVHLDYKRISIEKLFADWDLEDTGLQGVATGSLDYAWNKDKLLEGRGTGAAKFLPGTHAFGNAAYPIAFSGSSNFRLDRGVVHFRDTSLTTDSSRIELAGSLRIEDLRANLAANIRSGDFEELDKIAYNFAHATDKEDFELLGLGGSGTIRGTIRGPLKEPDVVARIDSGAAEYNNVALGAAEIDLKYEGRRDLLTFERALFRKGGGSLALEGTLLFPDRGPGPRFDLDVVANGFDVATALDAVELEFDVTGTGTGRLRVTGTPDSGEVTFNALHIERDHARLNLNGLIAWRPGEGNVSFNLDIGADSFPVDEIIAFLDLGDLPVTGNLTGTLHIEGPKDALVGAGAIAIREGTVFGEPVQLATADLLFTEGFVRATHVEVRSEAGTLTGEAEYHFESERFSYLVRGEQVDISRIAIFGAISKFFSGRLNITSSGAGTLAQPEIVLEVTLAEGTIAGAEFPPGAPPPTFYFAIREGTMTIRGSAFDVVSIEGGGTVGPNSELDGSVQIRVADVARFLAIFAPASGMPGAGQIVVDLRLGGKLTPTEAILVEGSVPILDLTVSGHPLTVDAPIQFALRNGRIEFDSFRIRSDESIFSVAGFIALTGDQRIDLSLRGLIEAALFQFFIAGLKAEGHIDVAAGITGTLDAPRINGTAEIRDAQVKPPGFPQLFDNIRGTLVFEGDRIKIDSLRATVGGGTVVAGGILGVEGLSLRSARVNLQGTDVSIRYFEGVTIDGDFRLRLEGDTEQMSLQGDIEVDRGLYYKDFDFATSLLNLLLERRALVPEIAASWQDRVALRIDLVAEKTLAVKNNIADATGSAELAVTGTLGNPVILGLVTIDEGGTVRFQDINYRVVRGTINFQNPFRIDPFFDITAEGRQQEYDLTINLTGTLDHITPTITSDPPISDLTLLTLLSPGGFRGDPARGLQPGALGSAGASLLVQSLGGLIGSKVFPFADAFRLDGGSLENLSSFAPTVTFEKQLSRDIRLVVVYNTLNQHNREIIEWQVTGDWVIQFTRDTERNDYAMDARFRRRYGGHW
ncbi:MAG TPA: translocation/assembly module TamB domain-containing protein, partial [Thermoanaerobaculia bacterium]